MARLEAASAHGFHVADESGHNNALAQRIIVKRGGPPFLKGGPFFCFDPVRRFGIRYTFVKSEALSGTCTVG